MTNPGRRVAITGIGIVSALGTDREGVWADLLEGRCGMAPISLFDAQEYRGRLAAEVRPGFADGLTPYERRRLSRSDQIAVVAAREALHDAGLSDAGVAPERVGVVLGAGTADLLRGEEYYADILKHDWSRARPSRIFAHFPSTSTDAVGAACKLRGPRATMVSACSSSTVAIGHAAAAVAGGEMDAAVCGGSDALARLTLSGFNALRLVDPEPCRPFDAGRNGMNIGEAGGILVLEELEHAKRRDATVYAEVAGYGITCEAYHPTAPEPEGTALAQTLTAALGDAAVDHDEIDHINAHGTATRQNDLAEANGLARVFGPRAGRIPVTSIKSMVGHCLGAAGAIEAAALALTIARGAIPPTIHHEQTDPACQIDVVANTARDVRVRCAVSISLAFGGNNAALVMRAV